MKQFLLAGAALVALSTASFAADMPMYPAEAAVAPVAEVNDWGGFFLGIQGGYNWVEADTDIAGFSGLEADGFVIGLYSGFNRQFGSWVVGIDNSISYADIDESFGLVDAEINTFTTTRGRIGYSFGNFMVFGAGGLALAHTELSIDGDEDDHLMVGWTAGGGIEAKFGGNWSARVEYLYADFGDERFAAEGGPTVDIEYDMQVVRGGIAYHF
jgi:outer membrane immunogenic protein